MKKKPKREDDPIKERTALWLDSGVNSPVFHRFDSLAAAASTVVHLVLYHPAKGGVKSYVPADGPRASI